MANKAPNMNRPPKAPAIPRPAAPQALALTDVYFPKDWNSRESNRYSVADPRVTGLRGLSEAMRNEGQKTPIDVRPNRERTKDRPQPWEAVTGFRRGEAIAMAVAALAAENETKAGNEKAQPRNSVEQGFVLAYVHESMTEAEAVILNATENLDRQDLEPVDVAFAVWRIREHMPTAPHTDIARIVNLSPTYTTLLLNIKDKCMPEICDAWRRSAEPRHHLNPKGVSLTVEEMTAVSKVEKGTAQLSMFATMLENKGKGRNPGGRGNWQEGAKKAAAEIGAIVGTLHRLKHVDASEIDWDVAMFGEGPDSPPALGLKIHKDCYDKSETGGLTEKAREGRALMVAAATTAFAQAQIVKTDAEVKAAAAPADGATAPAPAPSN